MVKRRITPKEIFEWTDKIEREGKIFLKDSRRNEILDIHTEPATYSFRVINPSATVIEVSSRQDPEFFEEKVCYFCGTSRYMESVERQEDISLWVPRCLFNGGYPILILVSGRIIILPKIYQIDIGGMPFFRASGV